MMLEQINSPFQPRQQLLNLKISIPLFDFQQICSIRDKIIYIDIDTNVRQILDNFQKSQRKFVLYINEINNKKIKIEQSRQYHHDITVIVYFQDEYQMMKQKLNILKSELQDLERSFKNDLPVLPCYNRTQVLLRGNHLNKYSKRSFLDPSVDIDLFISNPLIKLNNRGEKVSTLLQEIDIQSEIGRLRRVLNKNQDSIKISLHQANKSDLKVEMNKKIRILHLISNFKLIEQKVYVSLQNKYDLGAQELVRIEDIFKDTHDITKPDLVILVGNKSSCAAEIIFSYQFPAVIFVQTTSYNEDKRAHTFIQNLYMAISKGNQLGQSFDLAKRDSEKVKDNDFMNCCCLHPHQPDCKFIILTQKFGFEACHRLYHKVNTSCNCQVQINYEKKKDVCSCPVGRQLIKRLNIKFQNYDHSQFYGQKFFCRNVCCCQEPNNKQSIHKNYQKIGLFFDRQKHISIFNEVESAAFTSFDIVNNREKNFDYEYLIGVNLQMYELMNGIKDRQFALNIFGQKRSGRTTIVKQAIRYLFERYYPQYTKFQCNFANVQNKLDCEYVIKDALSVSKISDLQTALRSVSHLKIVIILDNCDYIDQNETTQFGRIIQIFKQVFKDHLQIIAISEKRLNEQTIGNRFWKIPDLSSIEATNVFVCNRDKANDSLFYDIESFHTKFNYFQTQKNSLNYQKVESIRQEYKKSENKRLEIIIKNFSDRDNSNSISLSENFQNSMNTLKANNLTHFRYYFLMFLYQFQQGLTELDFQILSRLRGLNNDVNQLYGIKPSKDPTQQHPEISWSIFIQIINAQQNSLFEKQLIQLKQFIDIIEIKGNYYRQIRLNDYARAFISSSQPLEQIMKVKIHSLKYLYLFTTTMLKYMVRNFHYHQSVYQFSNISDTGIFQTKKIHSYRSFYDENCFFPVNQDVEDIENAVNCLTDICIVRVDENTINEVKSITKIILQQKENIISVYRINFKNLPPEWCDKDRRKFEHYYYVLLVNISTISITITNEINTLFVDYCILNSIDCGLNIKHKKKTYGMLMFKLYITKLGIQLKQNNNKMQLFKQFNDKISQTVAETWDQSSIIHKLWIIQREFIKLYILIFLGYKQTQQIAQGIAIITQTHSDLLEINRAGFKYDKIKHRLSLYKSEFILKYGGDTYYLKKFPSLQQQLQRALQFYSNPELSGSNLKYPSKKSKNKKIQLYVKAKLNMLECSVTSNSKLSLSEVQELAKSFEDIKEQITKNQKQNKISDKQIIKQFDKVADKLKLNLLEKTSSVIIYLRSSPYEQFNQNNNRNMLRIDKRYKDQLSQMFQNSLKQSMAIFRLLTFDNLEASLKYGCLLLTLIIDCEIDEKGNLFIVFEDPKLPIKDLRSISDLSPLFEDCQISILIICGKNSEKFCQNIRNLNPEKCPFLISMDTLAAEHSIQQQHLMSINKHLSRVTLNKFIECFILKFSQKLVMSKIQADDFNVEIKGIKNRAYTSASTYIGQRYDLTNKFDQLRHSLIPKMIETKNPKSIEFKPGNFKDITYVTIPQNNIESTANNVGRLKIIIEISKFLIGKSFQKRQADFFESYKSQFSFLNVYGVTGVGKKTLMMEIAYPFLERKVFEEGIFMIDCEIVYSDYQGNILQYLEQKWNILFQKLNKLSKDKTSLSLLLILDNFTQIEESENEQFFKIIEQFKVKLVITTLKPYQKKLIQNTPIVKYQLKQFDQYEARVLLYSYIDINYYAKHADIQTIQDQLNISNNLSYIPGEMKKQIQKFSEQHPELIRKKKDWREERKIQNNYLMQSALGQSIRGQSNLGHSVDNLNASAFFNDQMHVSATLTSQQSTLQTIPKTKLKITSKTKFETTPTVSKEMGEPSSRRMSCSEDSTSAFTKK